jgi:ubiquinone/menaquinone biosynthesis C-methylase UbiE
LAQARKRLPQAELIEANAEELPFPESVFDLVGLFTVLSSIGAPDVRRNIANEAIRVLRPGGAVLWYDMRVANPWNRHVQPVSRAALERLFPGFALAVVPMTLVPQVARRLGPLTSVLLPLLHALPFLRTHWLGILRKPDAS